MGYDIDRFVNLSEDIAENFKCSVCLDIFEAPLELPCGHIYCMECIRNYFGSSSTSECPECRGQVQARDVKPPNRKLLCLLHNLNIKCDFASYGCNAVVKVENLIAHSRECRYNRSSRPSAPHSEEIQPNIESVLYLLGDDSNLIDRFERLHQFQAFLQAYALAMEQIIGEDSDDEGQESSDDDDFLLYDEAFRERLKHLICRFFAVIFVTLIALAPTAAIVISALKLHSCTKIPTLPHALMALGISMFLSVVLETIRSCCFKEKFCVGLKFIQSFAFGSLVYLAVVVYSNLDYAIGVPGHNSTLTCDSLVYEFSFWFVSVTSALIGVAGITILMFQIYNNLKTIWSEWSRSYVLLSFIYTITIICMIIAICTVTMGSIYFDSCAAIPSLTTKLVVFGSIGSVCWLTMLLVSDYRDYCVRMFVVSVLVSFIFIAADVHTNFPWTFSSHALHYTIDCNTTIYIYSFVIVCINYVIIGATILMYLIYAGICACLFFR